MPNDATDSRASTQAGTAVAPKTFASGRFVVRHLLGEGGQKTVYLARDTELERDVAVAVIKTHGLDDAAIARVRREAQTLAGLGAQPQIVTMYDIGQEQGPDGLPVPYLVCEYVAGGDLERELRKAGGPLPLERVYSIGQDLCRALDAAHSRGVLHRDLKPGNVWLTKEGHAKLGDFGLAVAQGQSRLTQAGTILGTASYMPPEQALGTEVDVRGDLYALGCVLYEMVTGRPPFLGDDAIAIVSQHINTAPVAASWHRADLPRALDALIQRLLEKAPDQRPQSARAVLEALAAISAAPASTGAPATEDATSLERVAGGVFVGREEETQQIRSALDRALSGQGNLLLLAGEPGIGKTRLAEELTTYARLRGAQVLWGSCYEGDGAPAYWPWVQAIRAYVHERDAQALRSEMGAGAADIAQVVSEVRERLPDLPTPASLEPAQARFRLFDSITTFLKNAAIAQPLVLILDDLHWADKPSLLLLQFVARGLGGTRLLLVGTYRDVEVRRQHPLSSTLAELAREQLSQRVVLRGLCEEDVARFIEMSCGVAPPERLVAAVHKSTEGNPFFVREVVNLLAREGSLLQERPTTSWTLTIPESVREVVGRRLDGLSKECNRVLTIAAVIGREFDLRTLEQITGLPGDTVLDLLEESVAARIVDELPKTLGRYSFSHALIRETLYEELTVARRVRLHRQIGDVLELVYASRIEPQAAELAHHFFQAGAAADSEKTVRYLTLAAQRAVAAVAYEEAARLQQMALQALDLQADPDEARRCELLIALGDTHVMAGDAAAARTSLERAAGIARDLGQPALLIRAAMGQGGQWALLHETTAAMLEEALAALGQEDSILRAKAFSRLAMSLRFIGAPERSVSLCQEAVLMARRLGDKETLARVLADTAVAVWAPENVDQRLAIASEIIELADEAGNKETALWGRCQRHTALLELGDTIAAEPEFEAHIRLAKETRHHIQMVHTAQLTAMRALRSGALGEAEQRARQALDMQPGVISDGYGIQIFAIRREQGRLGEMEPIWKGAPEQNPRFPAVPGTRALLYSELHREAEARAEFERLAADDFTALPRDVSWLTAVAYLSQVCAFLGDAQRAAVLYRLLLPFAGRHIFAGRNLAFIGSVSGYLGLLATTMRRWEEAERHFQETLAAHARIGARPWVAHAQQDYARMLLARAGAGDRERALALVDEALATAQALGMKKVIADCLPLKAQAQAAATGSLPADAVE